MNKIPLLGVGATATVLVALAWHGPGGAGNRFANGVDSQVRSFLVHYEMPQVNGRMQRSPLARRVVFGGPADDFQRTEIVRIAEEIGGVGEARWNSRRPLFPLPLAIEAVLAALVAFAIGVILAFVFSLGRESR